MRLVPYVVLLAALNGCKADPVSIGRAPTFPAAETMYPDLAYFDQAAGEGGTTAHWSLALERVAWVESMFGTKLRVPAEILRAASTATPENHTDHYRWTYTLQHGGHGYQGRIGGGPSGIQIGWLALASAATRVPPLQDYIWFSGTSSPLGQAGQWTVHDAETASTAVAASVEWSGDASQVFVRMRREHGQYLEYRRNAHAHQLDWVTFEGSERFRISWNANTGTGAVSIGQESNQCWNAQRLDSGCSPGS